MKIETRRLLLVAGIVWAIAGVNITIIGVGAYAHDWGAPVIGLLLATLIIFTLFHLFIFNKMVRKHADRIGAYEEAREPIWFFFRHEGLHHHGDHDGWRHCVAHVRSVARLVHCLFLYWARSGIAFGGHQFCHSLLCSKGCMVPRADIRQA